MNTVESNHDAAVVAHHYGQGQTVYIVRCLIELVGKAFPKLFEHFNLTHACPVADHVAISSSRSWWMDGIQSRANLSFCPR